MALEDEVVEFTRSFFRGHPDLSTLTLSAVRQKFLAHTGRGHLRAGEKRALKRLVEEQLPSMQVDEAGSREEKLGLTKGKRSPPPRRRDPERKRFRFNSESESSSAASSPDRSRPSAEYETAEEPEEASPRRALKKAVESIDEPRRDLVAKKGSVESSEEEGEGAVRTGKVLKEDSSEEDDEKEKEQKGRTRKKPGSKHKLVPGKMLSSGAESEDREEEPVLSTKNVGGNRDAQSHQESEESDKEILAKKKKRLKEPRARSNRGERAAWEGTSYKQKSRAQRLMGDLGVSEEEKAAAGSGDNSGGDEETLEKKSKDKTQLKGGGRQSGSSESEDSEEMQASAPSTTKPDELSSVNGESDTEREVSDGEAGESPNRGRKNSSKKGSAKKKSRTQSCSSSSDGSPEPKKAGSHRRGEDHPAVLRLKRYIRACGAHRNYKKLLGSCRSHNERLNVLRSELEALGMKGNPSLEKCRALKEQREAAAEMASLDVANIISSSGRSRRRTAWNPSGETRELYHRSLASEDEEPRQAPPDWSHMRGIISSDGESD